MRFNISIPADDIGIANAPEIGGQSKVFLSYGEVGVIGGITQSAPNSGTWAAAVPAFNFPNTGADLQLSCVTGIKSSVPVVVDLGVTFADDTSGTARATFTVPNFVKDQSANLPVGLTVDIVGLAANSAKKVKAVNSLTSITGGEKGNRFEVVSIPETYYQVGCARSKNETLPVPKSLPIACGLKGSAFVVQGRSDPGELELTALSFNYADGLSRLNGHRGTVMIEVWKADRVLTERHVYSGYTPAPSTDRGDGDDEVTVNATGNFEEFFKFV